MRVTLRLYRQHDLDLIALYKNESVSMSTCAKIVLDAYINKKTLCLETPDPCNIEYQSIPKIITFIMVLNEEKDKDIIQWLKNIRTGYRNSVVKNLIRYYMLNPNVFIYMEKNGKKYDLENKDVFEDNVKITEILPKRRHKNKTHDKGIRNEKNIEDSNKILYKNKEKEAVSIENIQEENEEDLAEEILKDTRKEDRKNADNEFLKMIDEMMDM